MGYLTVLLGAAAFYIASGEWISWLLLLLCLGLPWLSLLVSLGAIRRFRAEPAGLDIVETFLNTPFSGEEKHQRRINQLETID